MLSFEDRRTSSMSWILGSSKKCELVTRDLLGGVTVQTSAITQPEKVNRKSGSSSPASHHLLDLNFPPAPDSAAVEPQLVPASSVCTLEMVKLALDREVLGRQRKLQSSTKSTSSSTTTSSLKRRSVVEEGPESSTTTDGGSGEMLLAGCPRCLLYVMVVKSEPNCPRCNAHLPLPAIRKKQRILID